jgi:hypothetical protein
MLLLWIALAIRLVAALMLPLYLLVAALLRNRLAATKMERARLIRLARGINDTRVWIAI